MRSTSLGFTLNVLYRTRRLADPHLTPDEWFAEAPRSEGAWWPALAALAG